MKLLNNIVHDINHGEHQLTYTATVGTAQLEVSVDGGAFQLLIGTDQSNTTNVFTPLCTCKVRGVITGDALLSINRVTP